MARICCLLVAVTSGLLLTACGQPLPVPLPLEAVPGEYLVGLKAPADLASGSARVAARHGVGVGLRLPLVGAFVASGVSEAQLAALQNDPGVAYVEPNYLAHSTAETMPWGVDHIKADLVHPTTRGQGVKVGIIDTGIDSTHPDLAANYAGGVTFVSGTTSPADDHGHGTHVAGTVAAVLNNNLGVIGVAPEAALYALKVLDSTGTGSYAAIIAALQWAAGLNGGIKLDVVNLSLGGSGYSQALESAVNAAYQAGVVVVAAAGNSGNCEGTGDTVLYPARHAAAIAVAAVDARSARACFSSTGPAVELAAPGVSVQSTYLSGSYAYASGTSMATPHVSGAAALLRAAGVSSAPEVRARLTGTARDLGAVGRDPLYGYGLVDAWAAINGDGDAPVNQPPVADAGPDLSGWVGASLSFNGAGFDPDGSVASYAWDFGDGSTASGTVVTHAYSQAGTFTATLTVTDNAGATASDTARVAVTAPVTAALQVTVATNQGSYQAGRTVFITVTVSSGAQRIRNSSVWVTIAFPNGGAVTMSGSTNRNGISRFSYRLPRNAQLGSYTVAAAATKSGYTPGAGNTTFTVR